MDMRIPAGILSLMERLEAAGYQAWAVGGCVRDRLLGREPHDWDLCTDALPAETSRVFADLDQYHNGEKHGTVAVIWEGSPVEITTFRSEGDYSDHRRPGWVHFERDIREDLARRDFTVNAMAYRPGFGLADPFGGQEDLERKCLRAVGVPEQRFREDGLRILRGVRFAARFGLTPEPETLRAMEALAPTLKDQARERVFAELCGYLPFAGTEDLLTFRNILREAVPELGPCMGFEQHNPHHRYDIYTHIAHVVAGTEPDLALRWAALLHDVGKPRRYTRDDRGVGHFKGHAAVGAEMAEEILQSLRAPNALRQEVSTLVAWHGVTRDLGLHGEDKSLRRILRRLGEDTLRRLMALDRADDRGKGTPDDPAPFDAFEARLNRILQEAPCMSMKDLKLSGWDLMKLGVPQGPLVGKIQNALLNRVVDGELENTAEALQAAAMTIIKELEIR